MALASYCRNKNVVHPTCMPYGPRLRVASLVIIIIVQLHCHVKGKTLPVGGCHSGCLNSQLMQDVSLTWFTGHYIERKGNLLLMPVTGLLVSLGTIMLCLPFTCGTSALRKQFTRGTRSVLEDRTSGTPTN